MIKIAQLSCGNDYSGIQKEIEKAAETVGAKIVFPDVDIGYSTGRYFGGRYIKRYYCFKYCFGARKCPCYKRPCLEP